MMDKLQEENAKLKELLKKAVNDIEFLEEYFGCAGCDGLNTDWGDRQGNWRDCPFASDEKNACREHWKYQQEAEELLREE